MYIFSIILISIILFTNKNSSFHFKINNKIYDKIHMNNFINKLSPLIMDISYKLFYCFSWSQIHLSKLKTFINSFCDKYLKEKGWIVVDTDLRELVFIDYNGNEMYNVNIENKNDINYIKNRYDKLNYSSVIMIDKFVDKTCVNYVFYEKIPISFDYKVSNVKFIAIDIDYNNKKYLINLKDNDINFYIVGNCLNKKFFKYYIKNILKINVDDEDEFNYNVNIIDNNVSIFNLLPHQSIIINEDDYKICSIENKNCNAENTIDNELSNSDSDKSDDYVKLE